MAELNFANHLKDFPEQVRAWEVLKGTPFSTNLSKLTRLTDDFANLTSFESFLKANPNKVDEWLEFDEFFITRDDAYWNQFNNPPNILIETRTWGLKALIELPEEYVSAIESFSHLAGRADIYIRYGVDYKETFYTIIDNYISANPYNISYVDAHSIFGYTSNFFYKKLNSFLWGEINVNQTTNITTLLNNALQKLPTFEQDFIYRGIQVSDSEITSFINSHSIDSEHIWKGFSSCGSSEAASFSEESSVLFVIKHSDAKDISDLADGVHFRGKPPHELLIKNNSTMKVTRTPYLNPTNPSQWIIEVTQIK